MIVGVISYSISTGMVASIVSSVDAKTSAYEGKVAIVENMRLNYFLPINLFVQLK